MSEFTEHQIEGRQVVRRDGVNVLEVNDNGNLEVHIPKGIRKGDIGDFFEYVHHFAETGRLFNEAEPERLPVLFRWKSVSMPHTSGYATAYPAHPQDCRGMQPWYFSMPGNTICFHSDFLKDRTVTQWLTDPPDDLRALVEEESRDDEPEPERLPVTFKWRYCCDQPEDTQYGMFSWDGIQWHFVARGGSSSIKEFRNAGCIVEKWLTDPPADLRALVEGGAE